MCSNGGDPAPPAGTQRRGGQLQTLSWVHVEALQDGVPPHALFPQQCVSHKSMASQVTPLSQASFPSQTTVHSLPPQVTALSRQVRSPRHSRSQFEASLQSTLPPPQASFSRQSTKQSPVPQTTPLSQASLPSHKTSQLPEPHVTAPSRQARSPSHAMLQLEAALQSTPPRHASFSVQETVQAPVPQVIPLAQLSDPLHWIWQGPAPQVKAPSRQARSPSHVIAQEVASEQSIPPRQLSLPVQSTSQAIPAGQSMELHCPLLSAHSMRQVSSG